MIAALFGSDRRRTAHKLEPKLTCEKVPADPPSLITFLGTRGEIKLSSRRHRRHSSLLLRHAGARVMIDCGADWRGRLESLAPTAIVLTHAHPDHAFGLVDGVTCPVYATSKTWTLLSRYPVAERRMMPLRRSVSIGGIRFEAYPVEHSLRAPAVGYRISMGGRRFFYVPDVAKIPHAVNALCRVSVYIGDGATISRSMVRQKDGASIGHAPIAAQLGWCAKAGVTRAIFTHCGSQIVCSNARETKALVQALGRAHGIDARIAYDGLTLLIYAR